MAEHLNLDLLEELLETMEPHQIRTQYSAQLAQLPECEALLASFEGLDDQLQDLKSLDQPPPFQRPIKRSRLLQPQWALPLAACLLLAVFLGTNVLRDQKIMTEGALADSSPVLQRTTPSIPSSAPMEETSETRGRLRGEMEELSEEPPKKAADEDNVEANEMDDLAADEPFIAPVEKPLPNKDLGTYLKKAKAEKPQAESEPAGIATPQPVLQESLTQPTHEEIAETQTTVDGLYQNPPTRAKEGEAGAISISSPSDNSGAAGPGKNSRAQKVRQTAKTVSPLKDTPVAALDKEAKTEAQPTNLEDELVITADLPEVATTPVRRELLSGNTADQDLSAASGSPQLYLQWLAVYNQHRQGVTTNKLFTRRAKVRFPNETITLNFKNLNTNPAHNWPALTFKHRNPNGKGYVLIWEDDKGNSGEMLLVLNHKGLCTQLKPR